MAYVELKIHAENKTYMYSKKPGYPQENLQFQLQTPKHAESRRKFVSKTIYNARIVRRRRAKEKKAWIFRKVEISPRISVFSMEKLRAYFLATTVV